MPLFAAIQSCVCRVSTFFRGFKLVSDVTLADLAALFMFYVFTVLYLFTLFEKNCSQWLGYDLITGFQFVGGAHISQFALAWTY
jgi:hypothetical protein